MRLRLHVGPADPRRCCAEWADALSTATLADLRAAGDRLHRERRETDVGTSADASAEERFASARRELLAGRLFPRWFAAAAACRLPLTADTTVVQHVVVGPFLRIDVPVRVVELVDQPDRLAIAFATLHGHPERGVERYELRRDGARVSLTVDKAWTLAAWWVRPGTPLAWLVQRVATGLSLRRFRHGRP